VSIELDALVLQQIALPSRVFGVRALRDLPGRIQHSLPRDRRLARQVMQGVAYLARVARDPGELSDLSVARDPSARDASDNGVNSLIVIGRHAR